MNAVAPCPPDSAIMKAWEDYQDTADLENSYKWATRYIPQDDPEEIERIQQSGANPWTHQMKIQVVQGSLWAAFMQGWKDAGGSDPFKKSPTVAELEAILACDDDREIEILPNGSIRAKLP